MTTLKFGNKKYAYINLETGEIMSFAHMIRQAEAEYNFDDYTSFLELTNYYDLTEVQINSFLCR